jgi:hypothetical protein
VNASAATLLARLADEIERAAGDQEALDALVANLRANQDTLAATVSANTPADPNPGTEPTPIVEPPPPAEPPAEP